MDDEDNYTKDGTVDYQNWPANMKKTGTWKACPYILENLIFSAMYGQMGNLFLLQAEYMDTWVGASKIKIPEASLSIFDTISVIFWVPVYDRYIIPLTRKFTGHKNGLTQLQCMGTGLFISIFPMISAGVLEIIRLNIVRRHVIFPIYFIKE